MTGRPNARRLATMRAAAASSLFDVHLATDKFIGHGMRRLVMQHSRHVGVDG
jgi:hypothetical protein